MDTQYIGNKPVAVTLATPNSHNIALYKLMKPYKSLKDLRFNHRKVTNSVKLVIKCYVSYTLGKYHRYRR